MEYGVFSSDEIAGAVCVVTAVIVEMGCAWILRGWW